MIRHSLVFALMSVLAERGMAGAGVVSQYPAAGATGVALNSGVLVRYVTGDTANATPKARLATKFRDEEVAADVNWRAVGTEGREVLVRPTAALQARMVYRLSIADGFWKYDTDFTTGDAADTTGLKLLSVTPDPAGRVALDPFTEFELRFDKAVGEWEDGVRLNGMTTVWGQVAQRLSGDRRSVFVRLGLPGVASSFRLEVDPNRIRDLAGHTCESGPVTGQWATTRMADGLGPRLLGSLPAKGEEGVATNSPVMLQFDRAVNWQSIDPVTVMTEAGVVVAGSLRSYGTMLVISNLALVPQTVYVARVNAVKDEAGMTIAEPIEVRFKTGSGQVRVPSTVCQTTLGLAASPANTVLAVSCTTELPAFTARRIELQNPTAGMHAELSGDRKTLLLKWDEALPQGHGTPSLSLDLIDVYGTGVSLGYSLWFGSNGVVDEVAPEVVVVAPGDGETGVGVDGVVRLKFSEAMNVYAEEGGLKVEAGGKAVEGTWVMPTNSYYGARSQEVIEFRPTKLEPGTEYTVTVRGVADLAGNRSGERKWRFRTSESGKAAALPTLVRTNAKSAEVGPDEELVMEYSGDVSASLATAKVTYLKVQTSQYGGVNTATYTHPTEVRVEGSVMRVKPLADWPANRPLSATWTLVGSGTMELGGAEYFRAKAREGAKGPVVVRTKPEAGAWLTEPEQCVELEFSEPVDAGSAERGLRVTLSGVGTGGSEYQWLDGNRRVVIQQPQTSTVGDMQVSVTADLTGMSGVAAEPFDAVFHSESGYRGGNGGLPELKALWPPHVSDESPSAPLTFYANRAVDAAKLQEGVWMTTDRGRVSGQWESRLGGRVMVFRPEGEWPKAALVSGYEAKKVVVGQYGAGLGATWTLWQSSEPGGQQVVRSTWRTSGGTAENAVWDFLFLKPLGEGEPEVTATYRASYYGQEYELPLELVKLSERVLRVKPRLGLLSGATVTLNLSAVVGINVPRWVTTLVGPEAVADVKLLAATPVDGAGAVALNAQVELSWSGAVNSASVNSRTVKLKANGVELGWWLTDGSDSKMLRLQPVELLPENTRIEVTMEGVLDRQGKELERRQWWFVTGDRVDLEGPKLTYTNQAEGMGTDVPLVFVFNEPLGAGAVMPAVGSSQQAQLSVDGRSVTVWNQGGWMPGQPVGVSYYWSRYWDWSGNQSDPVGGLVTAGYGPDKTRLRLLATAPVAGQSKIPLDGRVRLVFNKSVSTAMAQGVRLQCGGVEVGTTAKVSGTYLELQPKLTLPARQECVVRMEGLADGSGNVLENPAELRFTTWDRVAGLPGYRMTVSADRKQVRVKFNQAADVSLFLANPRAFRPAVLTAPLATAPPYAAVWEDGTQTLVITVEKALERQASYAISLDQCLTFAGQASASRAVTFTPASLEPLGAPKMVLVPSDGSSGHPTGVQYAVYFDRETRFPPVKFYENGVEVVLPPLSQTTGSGMSWNRYLQLGTTYRLEVPAFTDEYGNEVAGASTTFRTQDVYQYPGALSIVSTTPEDGAVDVDPKTTWRIRFNHELTPMAAVILYARANGAWLDGVNRVTEKDELRMEPKPAWPPGKTITLDRIPSTWNWSVDIYGREFIPTYGKPSFRTGALDDKVAPRLEEATPATGAKLSAGQISVRMRFSEPVTVNSGISVYVGSSKVDYQLASEADGTVQTVTFTAAAKSRITLTSEAAIVDVAGNAVEPFVLEYETGEGATGALKAVMKEPAVTYGVAPTTPITVCFDRAVLSESVAENWHVLESQRLVTGTLGSTDGGTCWKFQAAKSYTAGAQVAVKLGPTLRDAAGWTLDSNGREFYFTIAYGTQGTLRATRRGFGVEAPGDGALEVEFNRELEPGSVNGESVWLQEGREMVAGEAALRDGRVVMFRPSSPLKAGVEYRLTLGSGIRAVGGEEFESLEVKLRGGAVAEEAELESVRREEVEGQVALRVRFSAAVSVLAAEGLRVEAGGEAVAARVLATGDAREYVLLPERDGELAVRTGEVYSRGRRLGYRRLEVAK